MARTSSGGSAAGSAARRHEQPPPPREVGQRKRAPAHGDRPGRRGAGQTRGPRGQRAQPRGRDEHQAAHHLGLAGGERDGQRAAHRVADEVERRRYACARERRADRRRHRPQVEPRPGGRRGAEPGHVEGDDAPVCAQRRDHAPPDHARRGQPVDQDERLAVPMGLDRDGAHRRHLRAPVGGRNPFAGRVPVTLSG
jgi:hypothetical protein